MELPAPRGRWWWPYAAFAAVHVATALVFLLDRASGTNAAVTGLPLDDSWIHLVYARAVATFDGFCYNPGVPAAGFTSPLWVVLLAPLYWLKSVWNFPVVYGVKILGVGMGFLASVLAFRLAARISGKRLAGWIAGLLVATDPWLGFAKLSGMEVLPAATAALWGLDALAARRWGQAATAWAIAPLLRPEMLVLTGPALAVLGVRLACERARPWRWVVAVLPTTIAMGSWAAYCLSVSGHPLPNTFYAKHPDASFWSNWSDLPVLFGSMLFDLPWFFLGSGVLLFAVGAWWIVRRWQKEEWAERAVRVLVVAAPLIFMLGTVWAHELNQSWPFYWNRYFQPAIPLLIVPLAIGVAFLAPWAIRTLREARALGWGRRTLAIGAAVAVLLPALAWPERMVRQADLFSGNCENINEMQVALGRWVARHIPADRWIATNDAGAIRYFGHRRVLDLMGLNDHEVLRDGPEAVMLRTKPVAFLVFPSWFPAAIRDPAMKIVHVVRARHYTICDCAQQVMVVLVPARANGSEQPPVDRAPATGPH